VTETETVTGFVADALHLLAPGLAVACFAFHCFFHRHCLLLILVLVFMLCCAVSSFAELLCGASLLFSSLLSFQLNSDPWTFPIVFLTLFASLFRGTHS